MFRSFVIKKSESLSYQKVFLRSIKTLYTPVYRIDNLQLREAFINNIKLLDEVLNKTTYNKVLLYQWKYKNELQLITSQDHLVLQKVIKDYIESLQYDDMNDKKNQVNDYRKLSKIGIQLFLDCHNQTVTPLTTSLTTILMENYNKNPTENTVRGIIKGISYLRNFVNENKIQINDKEKVDMIANHSLGNDINDLKIVKEVLDSISYNLFSDDIVRFIRGNKMTDELEITQGWKFPSGVLNVNDAYLRSVGLPQKKLVSIDSESLVLAVDGDLTEAKKILPSIQYATKMKKSLLLLINGDVKRDALAAISINNNKNERNGNNSKTIILKYDPRLFNDTSLQENHSLFEYLKLPLGISSVYSPKFSEFPPSTVSADKFYGSVNSLKATTGEAFLYNDLSWDTKSKLNNKFLQKTVTVHVGASSKMEIDQRISKLDNIVNNILCNGLSEGFIPSYGIALTKAIPLLNELIKNTENLEEKLGIEAVLSFLHIPMERALSDLHGSKGFHLSTCITKTALNDNFGQAIFGNSDNVVDLVTIGMLEPWNKFDISLRNTLNFISLLTSCSTIVSRIFEKPKKK